MRNKGFFFTGLFIHHFRIRFAVQKQAKLEAELGGDATTRAQEQIRRWACCLDSDRNCRNDDGERVIGDPQPRGREVLALRTAITNKNRMIMYSVFFFNSTSFDHKHSNSL